MSEEMTRRKFFSELCSKDTAKTVLGAWYGFTNEVKKEKPISCDDAGFKLGRKLQSIKVSRKEG
jgi:hypothetical protein